MKQTGSAAAFPATKPAPCGRTRPSDRPRSCARRRRSTTDHARWWPIATQGPQLVPDPSVEVFQHSLDLGEPEVRNPSPQNGIEPLDCLFQASATCLPQRLADLLRQPLAALLTKRFGIRKVSAGGASLALAGTLPFVYPASHGLAIARLACAMFIRGMGLSAVGIPSISAAYASVKREDLPMATTTLSIVMRIGGPTLTTICATILGWRLGFAHSRDATLGAFTAAFLLLCVFHALLFVAAMRLPLSMEGATEQALATAPGALESVSELR